MTRIWSLARIAVALLALGTLVFQFAHDLSYVVAAEEPYASHVPTFAWNFASFFTNQSNVIAAAFLLLAAWWSLARRDDGERPPVWLAALQVVAATFMTVTCVVYNVLLRGTDTTCGATPHVEWSNEVMHVVVPAFVVLDLLLMTVPRRVSWRLLIVLVAYPALYAAYSLLRAPFVTAPVGGAAVWYPYPFLDPQAQGGWGGVALYVVVLAAAITAIGAVFVAYARWRVGRSERRMAP